MNRLNTFQVSLFVALTVVWFAPLDSPLHGADIGTAFTYQGNLENGSGPVTDTCDFRFGLWDDATAGAQSGVSPQTVALVDVVAGSFTVALDFGVGAIDGDARWLEIEVQCPGDAGFVLLAPRVELTPVPHALRASTGVGPPAALEVDSVNGRIGIGTNAPAQPLHVVGTVMAQNPGTSPDGSTVRFGGPSGDPGLVIQRGDGVGGVARQWEAVIEHDSTLEVRDNTAGGLERLMIDTTGRVGIGTTSPDEQLTVAGAVHSTTGGFKFPDGTTQTTAATGGGVGSTLDGAYDQGGPGAGRIITADAGAVEIQGPDGLHVTGAIQSGNSIIIDGTDYTVTSDNDLDIHVGSGRALRMEPNGASPILIGGYSGNTVTLGASGATIGGGGSNANLNQVTDVYGTVGGGRGNQAGDGAGSVGDRWHATVGGGSGNTASGAYSTVGGGNVNTATGTYAAVAGGTLNDATGTHSAIGGGANSTASGTYSFVGGGNTNVASGSRSAVPGGSSNTAGGDNSLAAGNRARVRTGGQVGGGDVDGDQGTFVWADSTNADFASTGPDQFLIRAGGGVGIGTNSPAEALDVAGNIHADGTLASGNSIVIDGIANTINSTGDLALQSTGGRVGIGTTTPGEQLTVAGTVHSTTGGFKFPDGTTQSTAVTTSATIPQGAGILKTNDFPESGYTFEGDSFFATVDRWTVANIPSDRYGAAVVSDNGSSVYSFGGVTNTATLAAEAVVRKSLGGNWITQASMPAPRVFAGAAYWRPIPERFFVIGGTDKDDLTSAGTATLFEFRPATNTWSTLPGSPQESWGLGAAVVSPGHLYQIGGYEDTLGVFVGIASVYRYDINAGTWSQRANLPTPRGHLGVAEVNGKIYAIGGRVALMGPGSSETLDVVEIYDPATDTWIAGNPMPMPMAEFAIETLDDRIYCIGGVNSNRYVESSSNSVRLVQEYDTSRDTWTMRAPLPIARAAAGAARLGSKIVVVHGFESVACTPSFDCLPQLTDQSYSYQGGRELFVHWKD